MTDKDTKIDLQEIMEQMPDLILDLMVGLRCSIGWPSREFCILRDQDHRPSPGDRFAFYEDVDADLFRKLNLLVERGWIVPVVSDAEPIYRMTDEFAGYLLDGWPERRWPDWS